MRPMTEHKEQRRPTRLSTQQPNSPARQTAAPPGPSIPEAWEGALRPLEGGGEKEGKEEKQEEEVSIWTTNASLPPTGWSAVA